MAGLICSVHLNFQKMFDILISLINTNDSNIYADVDMKLMINYWTLVVAWQITT